jgi:hypothetical protein
VNFRSKSKREESKRKVALYGVTLGALTFAACEQAEPHDDSRGLGTIPAAGAPAAGASSIVLTGGSGGSPGISIGLGGTGAGAGAPAYLDPASGLAFPGLGTPPVDTDCSASPNDRFCDQMFFSVAPARRTLYSWTTAEQAAELRADATLLTRTETPGLGRGYAFTAIDALAARGSAPENQLLQKLSSDLFVKVRYAWPNAWATRMGWPGEDYGDQLLRIVLKPEAWIVIVNDGVGIAVVDMNNQLVSIADALSHSERIGAVYFYKRDVTGQGSFYTCSGGYREFIVGNEAMIEEWSLGTQDIHDRILADAELIEGFLGDLRATPPAIDPTTFNETVVCEWDTAASDEVGRYERSLSIPSEYYAPLPETLATLSQTLRASLFDPDPLIVRPGG